MIFIQMFKIPWFSQVFEVYTHFSRFSRLSGNPGPAQWGPMYSGGYLHSEVQCIMVNGHMGPPTSNIQWPRLDTCLNLFTGVSHQCWHLVATGEIQCIMGNGNMGPPLMISGGQDLSHPPPTSADIWLLLTTFVKNFVGFVKWTSNFWNQLIHSEIYLSTIMKEWNSKQLLLYSKSTLLTILHSFQM